MIHITRSHSLKILSGALAEKLAETTPADPFVPQKIIVPNQDTARWFKLFKADENGIAANIECLLPAEWLWKQIRKIYPDLPDLLPSDLQPMKWSLYQRLISPDIRKKFPTLDRYILNQSDKRKEEAVFQLAGQIASVFDEYLVYRPGMILRWQQGDAGKGDEKWQAELWRMLNQSRKKPAGKTWENRAELYDDVMTALSNREIQMDDHLYVLNPGLLPLPIINLLRIFGEQSEVFIYQVKLAKDIKKNLNELIQVFGRESESISYLINNLTPGQEIDLHTEIPPTRLLNSIQSGILNGNPVRTLSEKTDTLSGVEIRSCHSPLREIEVLHRFLLEKFEEDENLHPDDILVATPDLDTYRPYIKAVFDHTENSLPQIPCHLGYSKRNSDTGVERALLHLLSLLESRFEFSDVMDLFMMRPVYQSFGISESDGAKLKQWMEENHVVWGLDAEHRKEWGQPADELQTWQSALRRGWAGHLLGGEEGAMVDDLLLYPSIQTTNDREIWGAFSNYLHRLGTMRNEKKKKRSCPEWSGWLTSKMQAFFDRMSIASQEAQEIFQALDQISEQSTVADCTGEIPYSLFKNELASTLDRQKASGARFTNGVTFSSMVPVRSIPFKVIALIGLNANTFPRKKLTPDFDLMAQNPLPGERNRKNEDRNLFLESLMAAGQVHYCSYIGQSRVDNEEIPPSTIVSEWADVLLKISGLDTKEIIKKEALSGFSPANFETKRSYSEVYFQTAQNLLNDEDAVSGLTLRDPIPPDAAEDTFQIDDLIRFYSNPIRWFLRKRFEVGLKEADREKNEFVLDHLQQHILFQRVFGWMLTGMPDSQIQQYLAQSGAVPAGWAGERKVLELRANVYNAISAMNKDNITPRQVHKEISLRLGQAVIEGSLASYSERQFVDVNPSKFSGKSAINSWIKHLCGLASNRFEEKKSVLFCDLKKGEPEKRVFKPVQNAGDVLLDLVRFYRQGLTEPQAFFPKSLFVFEETEREKKKSDSFKKASYEFEGGYQKFGEKEDISVRTLMGDDVTFRTEFVTDRYRQIIGQMMDHMEEA